MEICAVKGKKNEEHAMLFLINFVKAKRILILN